MQYNRFGNTGMMVSRHALGAMTFGKKVPLELAQRITDEAIDHGVNLIDTADTYGESETVLGQIFKANGKRDRVYLCTKVFKRHSHDERVARNSRTNIFSAIDRSLRRLQVDHVDLLQLHHPDPDASADETVMALDAVVKAGKVRYVGCSNHYAWQIAYTNAVAGRLHAEPLVSVQLCYNLVHRIVEMELFHFVRKFDLGVMVYSPLAGGTLARHYDAQHPIPEKGREAEYKDKIDRSRSTIYYDLLDGIRAIAREQDLAINQLAVAWVLSRPVVSTVLLGGSKPEHFNAMYEIADKPLDPAVVQRLDELTEPAVYVLYKNQPHMTGPSIARQ